MDNLNQKQNIKIISLKKIADIVELLTKKYELEKDFEEEETVKKMLKDIDREDSELVEGTKFLFSEKITKRLEKGINFDEITPFRKLKKIVNDFIEKKINPEDLTLIIKERLDLPVKKSESLAKDIKSYFPFSFKKESFEKLEKKSLKEKQSTVENKKFIDQEKIIGQKTTEEKFSKKEEVLEKDFKIKKTEEKIEENKKAEDVYREPV